MPPYSNLTDRELAALLAKGDQTAFKVVYERYWERLLAVAGRRLNSQEEAEETLQNIFLNLWRRRENLVLRINFDHYFAIALKFEVINSLAKQARENSRNLAYAHELNQHEQVQFERIDFQLLEMQLEETIGTLPQKCQLIFRMSREQDLTNREIANTLNISEKAVEKQKTKALKVLRNRFGHRLQIILIFL